MSKPMANYDHTPAVRRFRGRVRGLASKHQQRSAQHLGYMALLMSAPSFVGCLSLFVPGTREIISDGVIYMSIGTTVGLAVLSFGIFLITRSRLSTQQKLNLGLVYQVLGSFIWAVWGVYGLPDQRTP